MSGRDIRWHFRRIMGIVAASTALYVLNVGVGWRRIVGCGLIVAWFAGYVLVTKMQDHEEERRR